MCQRLFVRPARKCAKKWIVVFAHLVTSQGSLWKKSENQLNAVLKITDLVLETFNMEVPCVPNCDVCLTPMLDQKVDVKLKHFGTKQYSHVTPAEVQVLPSTIPGGGFGLFTTTFLPKGIRLGNYEGPLVCRAEHPNADDSAYMFDLDELGAPGWSIDAEDERYSNFLRFVNHNKASKRNVTTVGHFENGMPVVTYQTTRNIPSEKELFVDYGPGYNDDLRAWGFKDSTDNTLPSYFPPKDADAQRAAREERNERRLRRGLTQEAKHEEIRPKRFYRTTLD